MLSPDAGRPVGSGSVLVVKHGDGLAELVERELPITVRVAVLVDLAELLVAEPLEPQLAQPPDELLDVDGPRAVRVELDEERLPRRRRRR